jgi:GGDEF domain-containing protein
MGVEQQPGQAEQALQALAIVLSVRNSLDTRQFVLEASSGVTYFDKSGPHSLDELTAKADEALYQNKENRRRARGAALSGLQPQEERS